MHRHHLETSTVSQRQARGAPAGRSGQTTAWLLAGRPFPRFAAQRTVIPPQQVARAALRKQPDQEPRATASPRRAPSRGTPKTIAGTIVTDLTAEVNEAGACQPRGACPGGVLSALPREKATRAAVTPPPDFPTETDIKRDSRLPPTV